MPPGPRPVQKPHRHGRQHLGHALRPKLGSHELQLAHSLLWRIGVDLDWRSEWMETAFNIQSVPFNAGRQIGGSKAVALSGLNLSFGINPFVGVHWQLMLTCWGAGKLSI